MLLKAVKRPEMKIWFADAARRRGLNAVFDQSDGWAPVFAPRVSMSDNSWVQPVSRRHRNGCNVVYFDGHAQWLKYYDSMAYDTSPPPQNDPYTQETYFGYYRYQWDPDEDNNHTTP
jgi:prepilin-type processing-associated H-X9-DG protein